MVFLLILNLLVLIGILNNTFEICRELQKANRTVSEGLKDIKKYVGK